MDNGIEELNEHLNRIDAELSSLRSDLNKSPLNFKLAFDLARILQEIRDFKESIGTLMIDGVRNRKGIPPMKTND